MDLSIVIVNWKVSKLVSELLASIAKGTQGIAYEIFVVDNDSKDGIEWNIEVFKRAHPDARLTLIVNEKNLGFAAASNQGLRQAKGRHVVLLNPDTRVGPGALADMVRYLDAHPEVGVAGPRLLNPDRTVQPSVRKLPSLIDQTLILLKWHRVMPWLPPLKRYLEHGFDYGTEAKVEQVMGAAFFIRGKVLKDVGLLDERFFTWFEEVDYCKRVLEAGYTVAFVPSAEITHIGGTSFAQAMTFEKQRRFTDSVLAYFHKHHGERAAMLLAFPAFVGLGAASLLSLWKSLHRK